jgi:endonuclease/exonuclease/phosphatase family metal-dependent hydrolase
MAWGGHREALRARQAVQLDAWFADLEPAGAVTVFAGDFNATPASATVRYLTGLQPVGDASAMWVDAWDACGRGPGYTIDPDNPWVLSTQRLVQIAGTGMQPARRIDYVMVRGWAHGRPGSPLGVALACRTPAGPAAVIPSDHYGVIADLWDPPYQP